MAQDKQNKIYGAEKEINEIIAIIEERYTSSNRELSPNSLLISGKSGTGKTTILEYIKEHFGNSNIHFIDIYDLIDREIIIKPSSNTIFTIDELDRLGELGFDEEDVEFFVENFSKLSKRNIIIGCGDGDKIFTELKDFFDKTIEIPLPGKEARESIIKTILPDLSPTNDELDKIVKSVSGLSGGEIIKICKEVRRKNPDNQIRAEDFSKVIPLYSDTKKIEEYKWDDLGGLKIIIDEIKKDIIEPLEYEDYYKEYNLELPKGILLYGPPGTGKTTIAKILANESKFNFYSFSASDVLNKFVGDNEKNIKGYFKKAKENAPSILFIDELENLGAKRGDDTNSNIYNSIVDELLHQMDGIHELKNVVVVGATNIPEILDPALVRPGRFDSSYEIPLPDEEGRKEIFEIYINKFNLDKELKEDKRQVIDYLAKNMDGASGADIKQLCTYVGKEIAHKNIMRDKFKKTDDEKITDIFDRMLLKAKHKKDKSDKHREIGFIKLASAKNLLRTPITEKSKIKD
jgi:SpoVK/Ycf46/Vps4 family AAA+-type ATPase